ncbi:hypothetical protein E3T23_01795 [Cryobacterium cheniae]|uniref:Uncharacterized protein n=1 Tax=Cryobacterium cheniae TaxID=1259262 RepID=A0A4R8Y057_9MICO|nr:hypothetical protein [Cryobacterium cheniae]TFC83718.1 hypothetical protein E3T23_01795 [Cryobacterium cheniae]
MTNNKTRSLRFRELVTLILRADGLSVIRKPEFKRLSEAVLHELEAGDIQGIPAWLINTRNEMKRDLSGALDEARLDAVRDGKAQSAVVWYRPGRTTGEAYVVMTLDTFSGVLLRELEHQS